uniref:acyl-CoA thioesterase II n=1 Tax=Pararhizobium sp. IMCC3301 TaxID=3067904 RepID=UPI0027421B8E|nr:acyl-CoA thioesterase II [Pararhizobium sp. IMCC3301]
MTGSETDKPEAAANSRSAIDRMMAILDLERIEADRYRGQSPQDGWQRVYGGQVIGQALVAASRSVEDRVLHSLHGYFLRPGDPSIPIFYEVERVRDGRSFCTRRVVAFQHGKEIFIMSASFQVLEEGLEHQIDMDAVPDPESLMGESEMKAMMLSQPNVPAPVKRYWERDRPIEFRPIDLTHYVSREKLPPLQKVWVRSSSPLPDDAALQKCALAYMSDMTLLDTALFAHGLNMFVGKLQMASLDHAMWFHRPFQAHDWMLYSQDSPSSSNARGFCRGSIYSRDGKLIASVAQEGLIRQIV